MGAGWRLLELRDHLVTLSTYAGPRCVLQTVNCGLERKACSSVRPLPREMSFLMS